MPRRFAMRIPFVNKRNNALTQLKWMWFVFVPHRLELRSFGLKVAEEPTRWNTANPPHRMTNQMRQSLP